MTKKLLRWWAASWVAIYFVIIAVMYGGRQISSTGLGVTGIVVIVGLGALFVEAFSWIAMKFFGTDD